MVLNILNVLLVLVYFVLYNECLQAGIHWLCSIPLLMPKLSILWR